MWLWEKDMIIIYQCAYNEKMHHIEPFIYTARIILPLIMKDHSPYHVHVATIGLQCGKDHCRQYPQDVERSGSSRTAPR